MSLKHLEASGEPEVPTASVAEKEVSQVAKIAPIEVPRVEPAPQRSGSVWTPRAAKIARNAGLDPESITEIEGTGLLFTVTLDNAVQGAFNVKEMTISFANVQNMRAVQGPLLRYFGIKHLEIDTAGGGGSSPEARGKTNHHQVRMAGIDNADVVRADIQRHLRHRGR